MREYFMVQRAAGGEPKKQIATFDKAKKAAERLSAKTGGEVFYVLQCMHGFVIRVAKVGTIEPVNPLETYQIRWVA